MSDSSSIPMTAPVDFRDIERRHEASPTTTCFNTPAVSVMSKPSLDTLKDVILEKPEPAKVAPSQPKHLLSQSCATSITENGWEGYKTDPFPEKALPKPVRNLRHIVLNVYRRLFSIVLLTNVAILAWVASSVGERANAPYLGTIVVANFFAAILIREDHIVNLLFRIFTSVPKSTPLWLRTTAARVYSLGGVHSGSSSAASMWLVYFAVRVTKDLIAHKEASVALVAITYSILALVCFMIALAMPKFRRLHHDSFEMVHRFMGWSATALLWAQTVLLVRDYKDPFTPLHVALRQTPAFWLVVILTASIASSWMHLKRVKVESKQLSNHALLMHFDYDTPIPGSFARVSDSILTEWHSFATIATPGQKGYSMIVSRAGDWTSKKIAEPPSHIWVRGVPTCGVMNVVPLFRRVVLVATGSGIAPIAPHVYAKRTEIKLLWTSRNIRKTYGDEFVDSILAASPDAVIYDTDAHGRPDLVKLSYRIYRDFNAEAVCIIANQPITEKVVYGLWSRGVPAFGAIWDS